jgi:peptidoglycan/LPS O-acetylase OafA/YrhL
MPTMPPSSTAAADRRLNGLDNLRAFAITYVFLLHYGTLFPHPSWVASVGSFGATGVDLFFVLSGYLMGRQLLQYVARGQPVAIRDFYVKRFFRIIPAYLFVLGLYFLVPGFREFDSIPPLWRFLTFTQNFGLNVRLEHAFSHAWSLCVEEHFYLVLPMLIAFVASWRSQRRARWIILVVFLAGLALRSYSWLGPFSVERTYDVWMKWIYLPTYNRLDGLLVGVCLAATEIFAQRHWAWLTRRWQWLGLMGFLLLCSAYALSEDPTSFLTSVCSFPIIALGYGSLTVAALSPACFLYRTRWLVTSDVSRGRFVIRPLSDPQGRHPFNAGVRNWARNPL